MICSRLHVARRTLRSLHSQRYLTGAAQSSSRSSSTLLVGSPWLGAAVLVVAASLSTTTTNTNQPVALDARPIRGGDVVSVGTPTKEPATGILFPQMCNGYYLAGVGHRVKYVFVKVYGVASYFDPLAMSAVKNNPAALEQALLDPTYPRTIQIVMARGLSADKFTAGIVESLEPRMKGKDLDKLEEFKKMNPAVDLVQGATIEMTIRGDTLIYKNAMGTVGSIRSETFTAALCDTYFGGEAVSPTLKESVLAGIPKL